MKTIDYYFNEAFAILTSVKVNKIRIKAKAICKYLAKNPQLYPSEKLPKRNSLELLMKGCQN